MNNRESRSVWFSQEPTQRKSSSVCFWANVLLVSFLDILVLSLSSDNEERPRRSDSQGRVQDNSMIAMLELRIGLAPFSAHYTTSSVTSNRGKQHAGLPQHQPSQARRQRPAQPHQSSQSTWIVELLRHAPTRKPCSSVPCLDAKPASSQLGGFP